MRGASHRGVGRAAQAGRPPPLSSSEARASRKATHSQPSALRDHAAPASPSTGVNSFTGAGLADALVGEEVVVDVTNSPSFEDKAVLNFFEISTGMCSPSRRERV